MGKSYQRKDSLYDKAKKEGYRSRASYKLIELDKRFGLLKKGYKVLDLGCYPGGWLQVAGAGVGKKGRVVGVDLRSLEELKEKNILVLEGDAAALEIQEKILSSLEGRCRLLLSDMSPQLTGISFKDAARSAEVTGLAFSLIPKFLSSGGNFVAKVFPGEEADVLYEQYRKKFKKLKRVNLDTSRGSSREFYFVGQSFVPDLSKGAEKA